MRAAHKAFTETLLELEQKDSRIFAVATDSRGSVTLSEFAQELPQQFIECGIAEQDAIGIGAGLACTGLQPFVCGTASFYSLRSAEQIKVDVAYCHQNVKLIGVSGGVNYGALGSTHHAVQDITLMRAISGLQVILLTDANAAAQAGPILTIEEHSVLGGLGAAVAEVVCQERPTKMRILGLPDEVLCTGESKDVFAHYGLTAEGNAQSAEEVLQ